MLKIFFKNTLILEDIHIDFLKYSLYPNHGEISAGKWWFLGGDINFIIHC